MKKTFALCLLIQVSNTVHASQAAQRIENEKRKQKFKVEQQKKEQERKRKGQANSSTPMFATYVQPVNKHNVNNSQ